MSSSDTELPDEVRWSILSCDGYLDLRMVGRARRSLAQVPQEYHDAMPYRKALLRLSMEGREWKAARDLAETLRNTQPSDPEYWTQLAYATRRSTGIDAARETLTEAMSRFPKESIIPYNLACYECQLGHLDEARAFLKKACAIDPQCLALACEDEDLKALWPELDG